MQPVKFLKFLRQFVVLVERNLQLIWNDKLLLASLTLQSPFMVLVVKLTADPNCFTSNLVNIGSRTALFILAAMATFMGTLNSYREICREREIILREASVGVSLPAVVLSKAAVLLLVEVLQAVILAFGFVSIVHVPQNHLLLETDIEIFITVLLTMFSSSCIGLLISALFTSGESAILAVLVLMIGQVVFQQHHVHRDGRGGDDLQHHRLPLGHGRTGRIHRPEQPHGLAAGRSGRPDVRCHGGKPDPLLADAGADLGGLPRRGLAGAADRV